MLQIGDKIIFNGVAGNNNKFYRNLKGTILDIRDKVDYLIEFEKNIKGHDGFSEIKGKDGYCWYTYGHEIKKLTSTHKDLFGQYIYVGE